MRAADQRRAGPISRREQPDPWFADFAKRLLGAVGIDPVRTNGKRDTYYRCDACDTYALVMSAADDGAPNWLSRRPL